MVWIVGGYLLNSIFMLIVSMREVRQPANALVWLTACLIFPVIGFGLYLIATRPVRIRQKKLTSPHNSRDTLPDSCGHSAKAVAGALQYLSVHGIRVGRIQPLTNGLETYAQLMKSVQNAEKTIDLEYYIYRNDHIGKRLTDLLIERAGAGIRVRFLRDGWGSRKFPQHQIKRMLDAGIECRTLFPVRFPWLRPTLNYRDHCKNVVIDGKEAFTGGINIGDEYTGLQPQAGFWRDTHVRTVGGEVADDLEAVFDAHWNIATPEPARSHKRASTKAGRTGKPVGGHLGLPHTSPARAALSSLSAELGAELGAVHAPEVAITPTAETGHQAFVQTLESNPGMPIQIIRQAYFICLTQATRTVDITTPYFVPDRDIIMAMKTAVLRGVRVRMLVPHRVDHKVVGAASRTYYEELLEAGVHIFLYDKGLLHAKVMTVDDEIAIVGAANYDMRSFRLDYEVSEVIYSTEVARELTDQFKRDLADSIPLSIADLRQHSGPGRILERGARLLAPLL